MLEKVDVPQKQEEIITNEVQLAKNILSAESKVTDIYLPSFQDNKIYYQLKKIPYIEVINEDWTKAYLKEEELMYVRFLYEQIVFLLRFASDYNLFLQIINEKISELHCFLVSTRSRNMAAAKLSRTQVMLRERPSSEWLIGDYDEEEEMPFGLFKNAQKSMEERPNVEPV